MIFHKGGFDNLPAATLGPNENRTKRQTTIEISGMCTLCTLHADFGFFLFSAPQLPKSARRLTLC